MLTVAAAHPLPGRLTPRPAYLLPQAGALFRCHMSEGQEAGRARYLERLVFGQPGFQDRSGPRLVHRPRAADRRACPPLASPQKIYY